jgi:hypothetical protein
VARQAVQEKLGAATGTVDEDLEERVLALKRTQERYGNVLRLAISLNDHLYGMVQAQRELSACFGELSAHDPELYHEFVSGAGCQ